MAQTVQFGSYMEAVNSFSEIFNLLKVSDILSDCLEHHRYQVLIIIPIIPLSFLIVSAQTLFAELVIPNP